MRECANEDSRSEFISVSVNEKFWKTTGSSCSIDGYEQMITKKFKTNLFSTSIPLCLYSNPFHFQLLFFQSKHHEAFWILERYNDKLAPRQWKWILNWWAVELRRFLLKCEGLLQFKKSPQKKQETEYEITTVFWRVRKSWILNWLTSLKWLQIAWLQI